MPMNKTSRVACIGIGACMADRVRKVRIGVDSNKE
jgi:hypothetical protein